MANRTVDESEARNTAKMVGLAALKYGDLSNQASKDYVFDIDRFTSFEGDTGPYILYTIVRIKSILKKYENAGGVVSGIHTANPESESERSLMLVLTGMQDMIKTAYEESAPHKICKFIYDLSNAFNHFIMKQRFFQKKMKIKRKVILRL